MSRGGERRGEKFLHVWRSKLEFYEPKTGTWGKLQWATVDTRTCSSAEFS